MSNLTPIDEMLKDSFNHFEASPPPNAWTSIQQHIPTAQATGSAASHSATVVKSTSLLTKVIIGFTAAASVLGVGYVVYKNVTVKPDTTISAPIIHSEEKIKINQPENNIKENNLPANKSSELPRKKPINKEESVSKKDIQETNTHQPISTSEEQIQQPEPVNNQSVNPTSVLANPNPIRVLPKPKHDFQHPVSQPVNENGSNSVEEIKPIIPNAFSPNNDGKNDTYKIDIENEKIYEVKIYTPKGELVFESNTKDKEWNGTKFNLGENCEAGSYILDFSYQYSNSEKVKTKKIVITLIREKN